MDGADCSTEISTMGTLMEFQEDILFQEVTNRVCYGMDVEDSLHESFLLLKKFIPLEEMNLNFFDPDLGAIRMISQATSGGAEKTDVITPLSNEARVSRQESVLKGTREARIYNRPESFPISRAWAEFFGQNNVSYLVLHLFLGRDRGEMGALTMSAWGKDRFSMDHAHMISTLRAPFTINLVNALQRQEIETLRSRLHKRRAAHPEKNIEGLQDQVLCLDAGLLEVQEQIQKVARLDCTVLLLGETGVGKEVIADTIHALSPRNKGPLVKINCGAIPDSLYDSEFFGHEKGAFTGAVSRAAGHFEKAHGGTLFLDEIGELSSQGQIRLLRVLERKEIRRIGGSEVFPVDVRVIAATNRDLDSMVNRNQFREDLWYRLNLFPILIPPLRERKNDIPIFAQFFLTELSKEMGLKCKPQLSPEIIDRLMDYYWPGNVRQLRHVLERNLILNPQGPLDVDSILRQQKYSRIGPGRQDPQSHHLDDIICRHIVRTLKKTNGKIHGPGGASELLGVKPSTLRNKMDRLGIAYRRKMK